MRQGLRIFLLVISSSLGTQAFGARPSMRQTFLKAVDVHDHQKDGVTITYDLVCGEQFRGVVVKESRASIALGIIVTRTDKICSTLPESITTKIAAFSRKPVSPMVVGADRQIVLGEAQSVTTSDRGLAVKWEDCGRKVYGVVLGVDPSEAISVQLALDVGHKNQSQPRCTGEQKTAQLPAVKIAGHHALRLTRTPGRIEQLYTMRVARPTTLQAVAGSPLEVEWIGGCREKFLGMVLSGDAGTSVGVLTMIAPNARCAEPRSPKRMRARLDGLVVSAGKSLTPIQSRDLQELNAAVQSPEALLSLKKLLLSRLGDGLVSLAEGVPPLARVRAAVMTNDSYGNLSAALISDFRQSPELATASSIQGAQRLPLSAQAFGPFPQVFDLKVFGTLLN